MWTISTDLKENKLIGQGLADIRQKETPAICNMQISNPCFVFSFHSQHRVNMVLLKFSFIEIPENKFQYKTSLPGLISMFEVLCK